MSILNCHLAWFKLKCPYAVNTPEYKKAYSKLNNASHFDIVQLGTEFSDYENQQFKAVVPISPERLDNGVTISTTSSGVSIKFRKHEDEKEDSEKKLGVFARLFKSLLGGAE